MERLHLWLLDNNDDANMKNWHVSRRMGHKYGHGDFLFDDVEFLYVKPRTPHEGHHKTGMPWVDEAVAAGNGGHQGLEAGDSGAPKTHGQQSGTLRLRVHSRTHG